MAEAMFAEANVEKNDAFIDKSGVEIDFISLLIQKVRVLYLE